MVDIKKIPIFTEEVCFFNIPNFKDWENKIKQIILVEENKNLHGIDTSPSDECNVKAKRTAWNSHLRYQTLHDLSELIRTYIKKYIEKENYDIPNIRTDNCWINWYGKNQHALPHMHGPVISVVLFVDVEETDAKLMFHANRNLSLVKKEDSHSNFSNVKTITPKNGLCVFFDGKIMHSVSANTSDKDRITVAINYHPEYEQKRNEY